ncbi:hypothetical protein M654_003990 [Bacillus sp. NSP9.1]|nr:hypothetical protein M654_003990 [Bacillus sp. NSP9.1]
MFTSGAFEQRDIEERQDVLVYSSPILEENMEVTGPVKVRPWAASSTPDTDFVVRLIDVHPDARHTI